MIIFLATLAVLCAAVRARAWIREWYVPWYETRLEERRQGLPRGSLAERWQTAGNGMDDDAWVWVLRNLNNATRDERRQLLRQR